MTQPSDQTITNQEFRLVEIHVGDEQLELNGFVMDLFQETICGMVRALGTNDLTKTIQITIRAKKDPT